MVASRPSLQAAAAVVLVAAALAGCTQAPGTESSAGSEDDLSSESPADGDRTSAPNRSTNASEPPLPTRMVWSAGDLQRVTENGSVVPLDLEQEVGLTSLRWGPDGWLYGASVGNDRIVRVDPVNGTVETFAATPGPASPVTYPIAAAPLADGRVAVLDGGAGAGDPTGQARAEQTRVVLFDADGQPVRSWADPRFGGPTPPDGRGNWGDIAVGPDGGLLVVTGNSNHNATTPDDPSDDNGTGAVWRIDPSGGAPQLVASDPRFAFPDGIDVASDGTVYIVEWTSDTPEVYRIPEPGTVEVVAEIPAADRLWGPEVLPDGRLAVVDHAGDPFNVTDDATGPGGIWIVDPATGDVEPAVSGDGMDFTGHVRVWPR